MSEERRQHMRVRFPLEVRWEGLSGRHAARVYDISLSGCYVETMGQVHTGEHVRFEVQSPAGPWVRLQGVVVHSQAYMGFGLRFDGMSEQQTRAVAELLGRARGAARPPVDTPTCLQAA